MKTALTIVIILKGYDNISLDPYIQEQPLKHLNIIMLVLALGQKKKKKQDNCMSGSSISILLIRPQSILRITHRPTSTKIILDPKPRPCVVQKLELSVQTDGLKDLFAALLRKFVL